MPLWLACVLLVLDLAALLLLYLALAAMLLFAASQN